MVPVGRTCIRTRSRMPRRLLLGRHSPARERNASVASEPPNSVVSRFGPNEWLVDEIYEQYLRDKNSVDPAWWDFFEDYAPVEYSPAAACGTAAGEYSTGA